MSMQKLALKLLTAKEWKLLEQLEMLKYVVVNTHWVLTIYYNFKVMVRL